MNFNTRFAMKIGAGVLAIVSAASAARPSSGDAPKSATPPPTAAPAIAAPYQILLTRSIFSKDGRAISTARSWAGRPAPDTQPAPTTAPVVFAPPPEASFVLRGVGVEDGVYSAFFEQTNENKGVSKRAGELIARGQIVAMSLDGIDYVLAGKSTHIAIGQALDGRVVDPPKSMTPTASNSSPTTGDKPSWWGRRAQPGTQPGAPAPTPGPAGVLSPAPVATDSPAPGATESPTPGAWTAPVAPRDPNSPGNPPAQTDPRATTAPGPSPDDDPAPFELVPFAPQ